MSSWFAYDLRVNYTQTFTAAVCVCLFAFSDKVRIKCLARAHAVWITHRRLAFQIREHPVRRLFFAPTLCGFWRLSEAFGWLRTSLRPI